MESKPNKLHIYFFPYMAHGHMIPLVDMARKFAAHGVKATILMTPLNTTPFVKIIQRDTQVGLDISIRLVKFPSVEAGLPDNCENLASVSSSQMSPAFFKAIDLLQQPVQQILDEDHPDCLVADILFPWADEVSAKLGIPRLCFYGVGLFPLCVHYNLTRHEPHKNIESDTEAFIVPDLPDIIEMTKQQLPDHFKGKMEPHMAKIFEKSIESERTSYGSVVNSFHELDPAYSDYYKNVMGRKAWQVGPVSLCNRESDDKSERGQKASIDQHECLSWLNSREPNSVLYVCFGSQSFFSSAQLLEIAMGLEASGQQFIWVVRRDKNDEEDWLPEGFEKRVEEKGLIIRGWAPQVLILEHESVGGFVTHCGWNSLLEGISAGVTMVTWPLCAEQFYNEKLVTEVLRVGVAVGAQQWIKRTDEYNVCVNRKDIEKAVKQVMVGEEAKEMRGRATALGDMANKAVEVGDLEIGEKVQVFGSTIQERQGQFVLGAEELEVIVRDSMVTSIEIGKHRWGNQEA